MASFCLRQTDSSTSHGLSKSRSPLHTQLSLVAKSDMSPHLDRMLTLSLLLFLVVVGVCGGVKSYARSVRSISASLFILRRILEAVWVSLWCPILLDIVIRNFWEWRWDVRTFELAVLSEVPTVQAFECASLSICPSVCLSLAPCLGGNQCTCGTEQSTWNAIDRTSCLDQSFPFCT